jgi:UDP-glucose 4-epimerase
MTDQADAPAIGTVLVTGAAGFLGSHVVERLSGLGTCDVIATDRVESQQSASLAALPRVEFRAFDLRDRGPVEAAVAECSSIVHLASVLTSASVADPRSALEINVGVTHDLAALAAQLHIQRFVYGSSHATYGTFQEPQRPAFTEADAGVRPDMSLYGASKLAAEAFLNAFADKGGAPCIALRFGTIYGPRINPQSNGAMLLRVFDALDRGEAPAVDWARDAVHGLIYVRDAAEAAVLALAAPAGCCPAINVVGDPISSEDLYETAVSLYGGDPRCISWHPSRTRYQWVSRALMREELHYEPRTSLTTGLQSVIAWHRERTQGASDP